MFNFEISSCFSDWYFVLRFSPFENSPNYHMEKSHIHVGHVGFLCKTNLPTLLHTPRDAWQIGGTQNVAKACCLMCVNLSFNQNTVYLNVLQKPYINGFLLAVCRGFRGDFHILCAVIHSLSFHVQYCMRYLIIWLAKIFNFSNETNNE